MATEQSDPRFGFTSSRPPARSRHPRLRTGAHRPGVGRPYPQRPGLQRISGPGELLQAVPYLLGFHPADSLVLVGLADGRLVVTARIDLPAYDGSARRDNDAPVAPTVASTVRALIDGGATEIIAVVYAGGAGVVRADGLVGHEVIDAVVTQADRRGCAVSDALLVHAGRWWSYLCDGGDCCPAGGTALPDSTSSFAAAATADGVAPMADRAALAASLDPVAESPDPALQTLIERAEELDVRAALSGGRRRQERAAVRRLFAAARACDAPGWPGLDDEDVAALGVALGPSAVRDAVWMGVDDGRLDGRPLWRELGRRLPGPYCAAPLFLFGWAAWRSGHGALASIAAERAVRADPGYTAADLLLAALDSGVDPRRLPKLRLPRGA